jgi:hypothetical protein
MNTHLKSFSSNPFLPLKPSLFIIFFSIAGTFLCLCSLSFLLFSLNCNFCVICALFLRFPLDFTSTPSTSTSNLNHTLLRITSFSPSTSSSLLYSNSLSRHYLLFILRVSFLPPSLPPSLPPQECTCFVFFSCASC